MFPQNGAPPPRTIQVKPQATPRQSVPAFAGMRERVQAALRPPARYDQVGPDLIEAANHLLAGGSWPRDLPDRLGVPRSQWGTWTSKGAADYENGADTFEADLVGMLRRATAAIECCLREAIQDLALKGAWQAPAKLLGQLNPEAYSEKVLEAVSAQVERLLAAAKGSLTEEQYEKFVRALEDARQAGGEER